MGRESADLMRLLRPWKEWRTELIILLRELEVRAHRLRRRRLGPGSPALDPADAVGPISSPFPSADDSSPPSSATPTDPLSTTTTMVREVLASDPELRRALRRLEVRAHAVPGLRACAVDRNIDWASVFLLDHDPLPAATLRAATRDEGGFRNRGSDVTIRGPGQSLRISFGDLLDICFGELLGHAAG